MAFRQILNLEAADALIMTGHNLMAMAALGDFCRHKRLLAMHFYHTGAKPMWQWRVIYRVAQRCFNAITYPSDYVREEACAIYPPIRNMAWTVRNPLDREPIVTVAHRKILRDRLQLGPDVLIIGNAGWLLPLKRFDIFLRVAARVSVQLPNAQFVIAGDGPERESLRSLARQLGIDQKVHWLGWQKDMRTFYPGLDVLLFNSDWDAFPTTPLEAMSFGVPVIASVLNGGLREVITDDRYGILLQDHDIDRLANATMAAATSDGRAMGLRGKQRVSEMSDPIAISMEIERLIAGDECG
jgi:glycosyltransferase involved in cell wall biosynthesis